MGKKKARGAAMREDSSLDRLLRKKHSSSGVPAISEHRLPGDPPAVGGQKFDNGHDVRDLGEVTVHGLRLVVGPPLGRFLAVEKWGIHRTRTHRRD
jgi:hypothetical protein